MKFIVSLCLFIPGFALASALPQVTVGPDIGLTVPSFETLAGLKIEPTEPKPKPKPAAKKPTTKKKAVRKPKPKPKPKVVYSLSGTWNWVAVCPVIGQVTGTTVYQKTSASTYTGEIVTSLKQRAKAKSTLKGRDFVQQERFGLIRITGQYRMDASGRKFSGKVNNGCSVTGQKR